MPSSTKFPQNRDSDLGAWAAVRRRVHAGAQPLTPVRRDAASSIDGADRCLLPSASVSPPRRRHGRPLALWTVRYYALFDQIFPDSLRCRRAAAAGAPTRPHARERPRPAPSRGADSMPPPATACARGTASRTTTSSSSSAASSASAARSGPRKPPPHCGTAAAVETNLEAFSSASGGVRDEPAPPHRSRRRRRKIAREADAPCAAPSRNAGATTAVAAARGASRRRPSCGAHAGGRPATTANRHPVLAADG